MNNNLKKLQEKLGPKCREDLPLAPYTTFKVGGPADLFIELRTRESFVYAVQQAKQLDIPVTMLGGGSNILIGDKGIRGLVIKNFMNNIVVRSMKGKYEH